METDEKGMQRRLHSHQHSSGEAQGCHKATLSSIPTRFQRKDPKRPRFDQSLVTQALEGKGRGRSLRQVASALLQKDSKRAAGEGKEQEQKRLFSVEEEEGRLAEGDLPQIREASPQIDKAVVEPDEGDVGPRPIISVEKDAAGEEDERRIELMEEGGVDILRSDEKGEDETMIKQTVLAKVERDTQSEVCSFFTQTHPSVLASFFGWFRELIVDRCSGFPSSFSVTLGPDRAGWFREAKAKGSSGRGNGGWRAL